MPAVVLLIIVIVVVLFLAKTVYDAQQAREGDGRIPKVETRSRTPRPRRQRVVVDEQKLADHVAKLRKAVDAGLVTRDEAAASIVRQADGALSEEAAHQLLNARDAA